MINAPSNCISQIKNLFSNRMHAAALQTCLQAVSEWPDDMELLNLYGELLMKLSRHVEAESCFRRILVCVPGRADVMNRLAAVLLSQGRAGDAQRICQQAAILSPDSAEIHANLGNIYEAISNMDAAERSYLRAAEIAPGFLGAQLNLGNLYKAQHKFTDAENCYHKVLELNPRFIDIYIGLAECCLGRGEPALALQYYDRALSVDPAFLDAHLNKSVACVLLGRYEDALASLDIVLRLDPKRVEALFNRGLIYKRLGQYEQATCSLSAALEIQPDNLDIQLSLSLMELLRGHYGDGWRLYTARKSIRGKAFVRCKSLPLDLAGSHVVLLKDQGLGDEIFFLRFAAELKARGARISYHADRKISTILDRVEILDRVLTDSEPVEQADYTVSVGDLPNLLGFDEHKPLPRPLILPVAGSRIQTIRDLLEQAGPPPWTGITWWAGTRGQKNTLNDRLAYREVPLKPLVEAVRDTIGTVVVVQRNPVPEEIDILRALIRRPVLDASELNDELEDMLALLGLLQDYIGVDNTNMHLAAGIGKSCRLLVPHPPEWRMQTSGGESPWFPGFRLYRQGATGDWQRALDALHKDLVATRTENNNNDIVAGIYR